MWNWVINKEVTVERVAKNIYQCNTTSILYTRAEMFEHFSIPWRGRDRVKAKELDAAFKIEGEIVSFCSLEDV